MNAENENKINLVELLKKYGNVVDYMTEPMVAQFYGVDRECIRPYGTNHAEELGKYGYRVYKKAEILKVFPTLLENIPNRGLRLYPIKAVILIGMMLTESKIAEELRREIIEQLFNNNPQTNKIDRLVLALYHCKGGIEAVNIGRELVQEELKPIKKELQRKGIKHPYTLRNVASCIENMSDIQIKRNYII